MKVKGIYDGNWRKHDMSNLFDGIFAIRTIHITRSRSAGKLIGQLKATYLF